LFLTFKGHAVGMLYQKQDTNSCILHTYSRSAACACHTGCRLIAILFICFILIFLPLSCDDRALCSLGALGCRCPCRDSFLTTTRIPERAQRDTPPSLRSGTCMPTILVIFY